MNTQSPNSIALKIEGLQTENGAVRLGEFIKQLEALQDALDCIDKEVNGSSTVYYRVTNLTHSSPATVQVEPILKDRFAKGPNRLRYRNAPKQIHDRFFNALSAIRFHSPAIPDLRVETLDSFRELVDGLQTEFSSASLFNNAREVPLDEDMRKALDELEIPVSQSVGSVLGKLLTVSFARGNRFYLYPEIGPSCVACSFPAGFEKAARENIKKLVRCYGTKYFRPRDGLPFKMDVDRIESVAIPKRFVSLAKKRAFKGEAAHIAIARDRDEWS